MHNRKFKTAATYRSTLTFVCICFLSLIGYSQIVINEVNYRSEGPGLYTEYIELYNTSGTAQNLSGWFIENGVVYQFQPGASIAGNSYLIVTADISDFSASFTVPGSTPVVGPWVGSLKNSGETISLRNPSFSVQDKVDYDNWNEWPSTGHDDLNPLSIQKTNVNLPGNHGGSWRAAAPTPGAFNGSVYNNNPTQAPIIKDVRRSPDKPLSTESVRVVAEFDFDNLLGINGLSVKLEYQKVDPGNYWTKSSANYLLPANWSTITMKDDGMGADSTANNGVFTAVIPASQHAHRRLIRYRIQVTNSSGYSQTLPDQNYRESNYAYYVYDGYPAQGPYDITTLPVLQDLTVLTTKTISRVHMGDETGNTTNNANLQHEGNDYLGEGTIVYEGRVYDHIKFRPRGGDSRWKRNKPNLKFDLNRSHSFETQNDCGQTYDEDRGKLVLSGGWVHDAASHGLTESLIYKIMSLTGSLERSVNYSQLRVVDQPSQIGTGGDFWGLYLIMEDYGSDMLKEHNKAEGNFWTTEAQVRVLDSQGDFPGSGSVPTYAPQAQINGTWNIGTNGPVDLLLADRIANIIFGQHGRNRIAKHSYKEYYDSETGSYLGFWSDMDNAFGAAGDYADECPDLPVQCEDFYVFDRSYCAPDRDLDNDLIVLASQEVQYKNMMRSVFDLLMNGDHDNSSSANPWEQIDYLVDQEASTIFTPGAADDWMEVDRHRWNHPYDLANSDAHVNWYKTWFHARANYMVNNSSSTNSQVSGTIDDDIRDVQIPNTPSITKSGAGFPVDQLNFTNSSFSDPQGNNTFGALEWRIAEWSDPTNTFYDTKCTPHYEIEPVWESGEITSNSTSFTIPGATINPGRTYKVRMRHKDNTGRWSHWSDAIKFIADEPINQAIPALVISEIHYNPSIDCAEFVEILNNGNTAINLNNYKLDNGVDFTFPNVTLNPNQYVVVVDDLSCYNAVFPNGATPIGKYSKNLDNGGEVLELDNPFGILIDSVKYNDKLPWDTIPDNGLFSLALINADLDNSFPTNWSHQCTFATPGSANDFSSCGIGPEDLSNLVINEIAYKPKNASNTFDTNLEFIEIKNTGTTDVNITGATFSSGIDLRIDIYHQVPAGGFFIIAKDTAAFRARYGVGATAQYAGDLSNFGEKITLTDFFNTLIDEVDYNDNIPWDQLPRQGNHSLALIDHDFDNNTPVNWSEQDVNYSPMADNTFNGISFQNYTGLEINELYYRPNPTAHEFIELKNNSSLPIFLSDVSIQGVNFTFADTDVILPGNFVVIAYNFTSFVSKYGFNPDGSWQNSGSLSNSGETIRLKDLFGNVIDEVTYSNSAPWDPIPNDGLYSLALKLGGLNNSLAANWSAQHIFYTPRQENIFDSDGDGIADPQDQCPNLNDNLIGTSCSDGDPCTTGETYDNNCNCSGGTFQDSDNDGVCNALDTCPGFNNGLIGSSCNDGNPCTVGETYNASCGCSGGIVLDSDSDGVCDANDICPGGDDNLDSNNNGVPDACENCPNFINESNTPILNTNKSANIQIVTNGKVTSGKNITYQAGLSVEMMPQFEVELGAIFVAKIDVCN